MLAWTPSRWSPNEDGNNTGAVAHINTCLLAETDLLVTCTGNTNVCDSAMLRTLKSGAVVCDIGHFDNEEVAHPMVEGFGGTLTRLTPSQADYIRVTTAGPFKPQGYKY